MGNLNLFLRFLIAFTIAVGGPLSLRAGAPDTAFSARSARAPFAAVSLPATSFRALALYRRTSGYSAWASASASRLERSTWERGARPVAVVPVIAAVPPVSYSAWSGPAAPRPAVRQWTVDDYSGYSAYAGAVTASSDAVSGQGFASFSAIARDGSLIADMGPIAAGAGDRRRAKQDSLDAPPPDPVFAPPSALGGEDDAVAIPDRWRLVEQLKVKKENMMDPYNQNTLKADRPIYGKDWFLNLNVVSDTTAEFRRLPTPVGGQADFGPRNDAFGDGEQTLYNQNLITSVSLIKGNTVFRPPDYEFRFTGITNLNYTQADVAGLLNVDPSDEGNGQNTRFDSHFAVQELFIDKHIGNKSDRYDFDSIRIGIQPFISDFRGFLFQDQQPGIRLFGNFINNRVQYNLAAFRRLNKDTNSGLNEFELRADDVYAANLYYQDFPVPGFQLQGTVLYNRNREGNRRTKFDENNFQVRPSTIGNQLPRNYDVTYFGVNGDGHFDRLNLTFSLYNALGTESRNQFSDRSANINAYFAAAEASIDFDFYRVKAFALYSSGDEDPFDSNDEGFDSIFDNPQFGGGDTSFFQRQAIPLVGGGGVVLSGRNSFIPSLRSSKEEGQSNFVNPGLRLFGVGTDIDILPELRLVANASYLDFDTTSSLRALRVQGRIPQHIGEDISAAIVYRPLFINNILVRLTFAALHTGEGFDALFDSNSKKFQYSALANVVLTY